MNAINNGKHVTITVNFEEHALLVGALQKGLAAYQSQRLDGMAAGVETMLYTLMNAKVKLD
ncbi:hypothetical protein F3157_05425 [Virgibacillus dakarensis]|nr:hypothetical protein [Virgibacillus dakarensis]